jgi:hypothetical protein
MKREDFEITGPPFANRIASGGGRGLRSRPWLGTSPWTAVAAEGGTLTPYRNANTVRKITCLNPVTSKQNASIAVLWRHSWERTGRPFSALVLR